MAKRIYLTPEEVAERYRGAISVRTLANWRAGECKQGPPYRKIGKAGIPKEIRDRIQNHTPQDVSSKSYERYSYISEKRAAMKMWNSFVENMLSGVASKDAA